MNTDTEAYYQSEQYDGTEGSYYTHTTLYSRVRRRKFIAEKEKQLEEYSVKRFIRKVMRGLKRRIRTLVR